MGRTITISCPGGAAAFAAALFSTLALGGCGGVEFQGRVFDAMGVSGERKEADVRMGERPPLVLPPNTKALPPPGSGVAVATAREDWPQNPEVKQRQALQARKEEQAKVQAVQEPLHPYIGKPTLFDKWFIKKKPGEPEDDVPEPDPSDKPPDEAVVAAKPKPLTPHVPQEIKPTEDLFHPAPPESYKNPTAGY